MRQKLLLMCRLLGACGLGLRVLAAVGDAGIYSSTTGEGIVAKRLAGAYHWKLGRWHKVSAAIRSVADRGAGRAGRSPKHRAPYSLGSFQRTASARYDMLLELQRSRNRACSSPGQA
jgi:hypothetical protein